MRAALFAGLFGLAFAIAAGAADACTRSIPAQAGQAVVPTQQINQSLFDAAVRAEVNFHRCRAGLSALQPASSGLVEVARGHSVWMASAGTLSHKSNVRGRSSLTQRVKASGESFRAGAENIGMVHRYRIDNQRFRIVDSNACHFTKQDGTPLPAHSYASLARHAVDLWMNSPGHRKNILDRRMTRISTAVAFDPKAQYCGRFWMTQNFIG